MTPDDARKYGIIGTQPHDDIDERDVLRALTTDALRNRAGYTPSHDTTATPKPDRNQKLYTVDIVRSSDEITHILQWLDQRGIIAGSTGTWLAGWGDDVWFPQDIDIFTFNEKDFLALDADVNYFPDADCQPITRRYTIRHDRGERVRVDLNILPPREGVHTIADLLNSFDYSASMYALLPVGELVTIGQGHHSINNQAYIKNHDSPVSTLRRILHYFTDYGIRPDFAHLHELIFHYPMWNRAASLLVEPFTALRGIHRAYATEYIKQRDDKTRFKFEATLYFIQEIEVLLKSAPPTGSEMIDEDYDDYDSAYDY